MSKLLLLLLVFVIAYWFIKTMKRNTAPRPRSAPRDAGEDMVRCAQCGVHLPRSESVMSRELFYCSVDHRRECEKSV